MIDTFDTAADAGAAHDWDAKRAAQDRLHAELQSQNQAALFDALAAAGVTLIVVTFDGYGDSGQIKNMEIKAGDAVVAMPAGEIGIAGWISARSAVLPSRSPSAVRSVRPADVSHQPLRACRRLRGFPAHLHSFVVTMSQKSSVAQPTLAVS